MSASIPKAIQVHKRELDALVALVMALSESLTKAEERITALENGNRQRRTPSSNRRGHSE
jgi:prefoldin subunit 5